MWDPADERIDRRSYARATMTSIAVHPDQGVREVNVVVVAAHPALRTGVGTLLAAEPDMKIVGSGAGLDTVTAAARRSGVDVVVVDNGIAGISSPTARAALEVLAARLPAIVMGAGDRKSYESAEIAAGAAGYWPKFDDPDSLVKSIRAAAGRRAYGDRRHSHLSSPSRDHWRRAALRHSVAADFRATQQRGAAALQLSG